MHVHCLCPPKPAVRRFLRRNRRAGHLDHEWSSGEMIRSIQESVNYRLLDINPRMDVDTSPMFDLQTTLCKVHEAFDGQ